MPAAPISSEDRVELETPVVDHSAAGASRLGAAYWDEVRAYSRGLVLPRSTGDGVDLLLLRVLPLLRFRPAETVVAEGVVECRFPIRGGLLVAAPGGALVIAQLGGERPELRLAVDGFRPRLARRRLVSLYRLLQAPLHAGVSRRFLRRAARGPL